LVISELSRFFTYSGPVADLSLISVLIIRRRWLRFPAFFMLVAFDLLITLCVSLVPWSDGSRAFRTLYYSLDLADLSIQVWLVFELLKNVLAPREQLAKEGKRKFVTFSSLGAGFALLAALLFRPIGLHGADLLAMQGDIFASLLVCEAVIAIMISASRLGIGWRNHVLAIGQGLMFWAVLVVSVHGLGAFISPESPVFTILYYLRSVAYIAMVAYWSVSLWQEEPARKPISPELRKYIVALHDQVQ
jgi:hypothetical protein